VKVEIREGVRREFRLNAQIDESGPSHIARNEFGGCGDSGEQEGEVTGRGCSETELFTQYMPVRHAMLFPAPAVCYLDANLVTVTMSVVNPKSSPILGERCRCKGRIEDRRTAEVAGAGQTGTDITQSTIDVDPAGRRSRDARRETEATVPTIPPPIPTAPILRVRLENACL